MNAGAQESVPSEATARARKRLDGNAPPNCMVNFLRNYLRPIRLLQIPAGQRCFAWP